MNIRRPRDQEEESERVMFEARMKRELKFKRATLASMLATPLMTPNFSAKYPTQTGSLVLPFCTDNSAESNDSGETSSKALTDMKKESKELSSLMKKVRHKPLVKKKNKKKYKGFDKRRKKQAEEEKRFSTG